MVFLYLNFLLGISVNPHHLELLQFEYRAIGDACVPVHANSHPLVCGVESFDARDSAYDVAGPIVCDTISSSAVCMKVSKYFMAFYT